MERKSKSEKLSTCIIFRCKPGDKAKWEAKAQKRGQTLTELITKALNRKDENGR